MSWCDLTGLVEFGLACVNHFLYSAYAVTAIGALQSFPDYDDDVDGDDGSYFPDGAFCPFRRWLLPRMFCPCPTNYPATYQVERARKRRHFNRRSPTGRPNTASPDRPCSIADWFVHLISDAKHDCTLQSLTNAADRPHRKPLSATQLNVRMPPLQHSIEIEARGIRNRTLKACESNSTTTTNNNNNSVLLHDTLRPLTAWTNDLYPIVYYLNFYTPSGTYLPR